MKNIIFASFLFGLSSLYAQTPCFPNLTYTAPGYYPDSIQNLPPANVGVYYEEVITVVVPTDTNITQVGVVPIDSVMVDSIVGLPGGFQWGCHNPRCHTLGGSRGCTVIWGMPSFSYIGDNKLDIFVTLFGRVFGTIPVAYHTVIKAYKITINGSLPCIPDINASNIWFNPDFTGVTDNANVYELFSKQFTLVTPQNYFINGNNAPVDSVVLQDAVGLPSSFDAYFTNNIMQIPGNSRACILIEGVPQPGEEGTYTVSFNARIYATPSGNPQLFRDTVFDNYKIVIPPYIGVGEFSDISKDIVVFPNPFRDEITILLSDDFSGVHLLEITDLAGKVVHSKSIMNSDRSKKISISLAELSSGMYFLKLSTTAGKSFFKLIKE